MTRFGKLAAVLGIVLLAGFLSPASAVSFAGGTGEPNNPYLIATAEQLIAVGSDPNLLTKHFVLTADIDLDPNLPGRRIFDRAVISPYTDVDDPGYYGPFTGVFDGNGHAISHLTMVGKRCLGLFGWLKQDGRTKPTGEIRNLRVEDVNIVASDYCAGAIVGWNDGVTLLRSCSSGRVSGTEAVGGLVGYVSFGNGTGFNPHDTGTMTDCNSTCAVTGWVICRWTSGAELR
jgi:hypothetical protein